MRVLVMIYGAMIGFGLFIVGTTAITLIKKAIE